MRHAESQGRNRILESEREHTAYIRGHKGTS